MSDQGPLRTAPTGEPGGDVRGARQSGRHRPCGRGASRRQSRRRRSPSGRAAGTPVRGSTQPAATPKAPPSFRDRRHTPSSPDQVEHTNQSHRPAENDADRFEKKEEGVSGGPLEAKGARRSGAEGRTNRGDDEAGRERRDLGDRLDGRRRDGRSEAAETGLQKGEGRIARGRGRTDRQLRWCVGRRLARAAAAGRRKAPVASSIQDSVGRASGGATARPQEGEGDTRLVRGP